MEEILLNIISFYEIDKGNLQVSNPRENASLMEKRPWSS
jgi:hypothetical protein